MEGNQPEAAQKELTEKEALFVLEYLKDFNGRRAAIAAGYSANSATEIASENLRKPHIEFHLQKAINDRRKRVENEADEVLRLLFEVARTNIKRIVPEAGKTLSWDDIRKLPDDVTRCISELSIDKSGALRVKFWNKMDALDKLMRHLGMYEATLALPEPEEGNSNESPSDPFIDALGAKAAEVWGSEAQDGKTDAI